MQIGEIIENIRASAKPINEHFTFSDYPGIYAFLLILKTG